MRMLLKLKQKLDQIEANNEWEYEFVSGLLIQMEEGRDFKKNKLSDKQFNILVRISSKYQDL